MERPHWVSYSRAVSRQCSKLLIPPSSECLAILQGHTSLVGQLQMRGDTLVTGGSDGSVRVWSLERFCAIHRLAAHDNSVTSLQFDDTRVVSGGSDGRVKVWDLKTGQLVRELVTQGEAVWRVAFEDEKCVAMALKNGRTVMEVRKPNRLTWPGRASDPSSRSGRSRPRPKCSRSARCRRREGGPMGRSPNGPTAHYRWTCEGLGQPGEPKTWRCRMPAPRQHRFNNPARRSFTTNEY